MTDLISAAIRHAVEHCGATRETEWKVTFANDKVNAGRLKDLGDGAYVMTSKKSVYYFHVSQVLYLRIAQNE
jgi:hypothetical protein